MADTSNLTNFLTDVADAIRTKKETTEQIPAENFDQEILSIETGIDTSDATAIADDIIHPKTAYTKDGKITGNMQLSQRENSLGHNYTKSSNVITKTNYRHSTKIMPDGNVLAIVGSNINVYDKVGNLLNTYAVSTFGTHSNHLTIDACGIPNSNGAYLVIIMSSTYDTGGDKCYYSVTYYKDNKLHAKVYDTQTVTYTNSNCKADYGFAGIVACKTMSNQFYIDGRGTGLLKITVDENLNMTKSSLSITNYDNTRVIRLSISDDDNYLYINMDKPWDGGRSGIIYLPSATEFHKNAYQSDIIPITVNGKNYCIAGDKLYSLNITSMSLIKSSFTGVYNSTIGSNANPTGYRYGVANDKYLIISNVTTNAKIYSINDISKGDISFIEDITTVTGAYICTYRTNDYMGVGTSSQQGYLITTHSAELEDDYIIHAGYTLHNTSNSNVTANDIVEGKIAYGSEGKIEGTMPNNGELNYVPSTEAQTIPAGYTSGGTIAAINNQDKEVTENGTYTADEGYTGLGTVTVNVPQKGGSGDVKLFKTEKEMTEDLNNLGKVGDLSILYNTEYDNVPSGEIVNTVIFPETVVFDSAISTTITGEFVCIGEEQWNYTVTLTPTSYVSSRNYRGETIMVEYTSEDGITYTRITELKDNKYTFDLIDGWSTRWSNQELSNFIKNKTNNFYGLYERAETDTLISLYDLPIITSDEATINILQQNINLDNLSDFMINTISSALNLNPSQSQAFVIIPRDNNIFEIYYLGYTNTTTSGYHKIEPLYFMGDETGVHLGGYGSTYRYDAYYKLSVDMNNSTYTTTKLTREHGANNVGYGYTMQNGDKFIYCKIDREHNKLVPYTTFKAYYNQTNLRNSLNITKPTEWVIANTQIDAEDKHVFPGIKYLGKNGASVGTSLYEVKLFENETLLQADTTAKDDDLAVVYDGSFKGMYKYEHRLRTDLYPAYINPRIENGSLLYNELTYIDFNKLKQVVTILKSSTDLTTNSYNRYLIIPKSDTIYWCYCSFVTSNSYWDEAAIYNDGTTRYITGSSLGNNGTKFRKVIVDLSTEAFELREITATTYNYQYMCETFEATDAITDIWINNSTGQFYVYGTNSGTTNNNSNKQLISGLKNPTIPMYYLADYTNTITPTEYDTAVATTEDILGNTTE